MQYPVQHPQLKLMEVNSKEFIIEIHGHRVKKIGRLWKMEDGWQYESDALNIKRTPTTRASLNSIMLKLGMMAKQSGLS